MKATAIRFFSPEENSEPKGKKTSNPSPVTGYISGGGKLVFPQKSIAQLDIDPNNTRFRIGVQEGKRKIKTLYLVPTNDEQSESFELVKAAKSYTISLSLILKNNGLDYANTKYTFTIKPFDYDAGVTAFELQLSDDAPKSEYTGKPRGRKPKNQDAGS
ncbi:hypothetical protein GCM10027341_35670 [Spirosoma knui]